MKKLLIDKYEPRYLDDFNYEKDYLDYIGNLTQNTDLNILLYGNMGSGKSIFIDAILYNYYGVNSIHKIKNNVLYISSLKEQGVSFYKSDVKTFCQSTSEIYGKKKCIVIDNLDTLSDINQNIFKIHMDTYSQRVIFLCSCTNLNKISAVILNHFVVVKMKSVDKGILEYTFDKINEQEKLKVSESLKRDMIKYSNNSIKLLINNLEKYRIIHDKIDYGLENINNNILVKELVEYYDLCKIHDRENGYKKLLEIYEDGYSIIDIIEYMYLNLKFNQNIEVNKKYEIIKILSKYLLSVNNSNEDELIIYFLTNDIIDKI